MVSVLARSVVALVVVTIHVAVAVAAPDHTIEVVPSGIPPRDLGGSIIFLNRCVGGCVIHPADRDNATTDTSAIPKMMSNLPEYPGFLPGEWDSVVACVREVYSPYNVSIVDTRPASGDYAMIYVGGKGADVQETMAGVGGVALLTQDCSPSSLHGVAFAFTDQIDVFAREDGNNRVHGLCWIIAQETAHVFGLDHEFSFTADNSSACSDPMTYRDECGGQKFFRNREARCGEFTKPRDKCGPTNGCSITQNSHQQLVGLFGAKPPITGPPLATITSPTVAMTPVFANGHVLARASAPRAVSHVELWVNGFQWGLDVKGAAIGSTGQPESTYDLSIPAALPDSILDLTVKAFDDIGGQGNSQTVTVFKGAPAGCADATTCATGQKCEAGRCFWDPPSGEIGDACKFDQACKSFLCTGTDTQTICTHRCALDDPMACEAGLTCAATSATSGVCFLPDTSGCCSVGRSSTASTAMRLGLAVGILGLVLRRRRRT